MNNYQRGLVTFLEQDKKKMISVNMEHSMIMLTGKTRDKVSVLIFIVLLLLFLPAAFLYLIIVLCSHHYEVEVLTMGNREVYNLSSHEFNRVSDRVNQYQMLCMSGNNSGNNQ